MLAQHAPYIRTDNRNPIIGNCDATYHSPSSHLI